MKILFVTNNYKPYSGGVVSSIDAFCNELRSQGHVVKIVTLDFTGSPENDQNIIKIVCPFRFFYKHNPIAIPLFMQLQLRKIIKLYKPDIVHTHHPFLLGVAAQNVCLQQGIPLIFTYHSQYGLYATHYAPFFKKIVRFCVEKKVKKFCEKVTAIIAPSQSIAHYLKKQKIKTPCYTLASGLLPCFFHKKREQKKSKKVFNLLTVGRFVTEKNIPFLLDVMKHLDERFVLTLIGFGAYYQELQKYAYQICKLSTAQVQFIEKPAQTLIAQWYKKADLFVFASTSETQGLVCVESMAAGTPVIAVKGPGVKECVKNDSNGYLVKTRKQMVQKIKEVANNASLHEKLCKGAWKTAKEYSIKKSTQKLIAVYEEIV
ncbi:glycosyltransferase [Candidatus Babeliales bacterium]|nr:glycosyltransferase [Candidatus Babeliales bacterium]